MTELQKRLVKAEERVTDKLLPGWGEYLARDEVHDRKLKACHELLVAAVKNDDEYAFERILADWVQLWRQVNQAVAEDYRRDTKPENWELRYFRWMKVKFMRLASPAGEFYLVPEKPKGRPRAKYWYTADEMIDMMSSDAIRATIKELGVLPSRPEAEQLAVGAQEMHVDLTGEEPKAWVKHRLTEKWTVGGNRVTLAEVVEVSDG